MNITASDRETLVRFASGLSNGNDVRRAILAGLVKVAHLPVLGRELINQQAYSRDMCRMMFCIDAEKNNSKYYEIAIVPDGAGTYTLVCKYGALTDQGRDNRPPGADRVEKHGLSLSQAKSAMYAVERKRMNKPAGKAPYVDAFATKPAGQYPMGLDRTVGFGHGTQEITKKAPVLRRLLQTVDEAVGTDMSDGDSIAIALAEAARELSDLGTSTMAREIEKLINAPASRLLNSPSFVRDPNKLHAELVKLRNYLQNQLSTSNV